MPGSEVSAKNEIKNWFEADSTTRVHVHHDFLYFHLPVTVLATRSPSKSLQVKNRNGKNFEVRRVALLRKGREEVTV